MKLLKVIRILEREGWIRESKMEKGSQAEHHYNEVKNILNCTTGMLISVGVLFHNAFCSAMHSGVTPEEARNLHTTDVGL